MASSTSTGAYFLFTSMQNSVTRKQHREVQRPLSLLSLSHPTFSFHLPMILPKLPASPKAMWCSVAMTISDIPLSFYDPSQTTLFPPKPCDACSVALTISDISTYEPQVQQMDGDPARSINCSWRKGLLM